MVVGATEIAYKGTFSGKFAPSVGWVVFLVSKTSNSMRPQKTGITLSPNTSAIAAPIKQRTIVPPAPIAANNVNFVMLLMFLYTSWSWSSDSPTVSSVSISIARCAFSRRGCSDATKRTGSNTKSCATAAARIVSLRIVVPAFAKSRRAPTPPPIYEQNKYCELVDFGDRHWSLTTDTHHALDVCYLSPMWVIFTHA